jgi:hypothetical protein
MGKKLEYTPNSKIRQALRKLTLWSRERNAAMKRDKYTCTTCGKKKSARKGFEVKVEAHHKNGIDWQGVCDFIRERVLQTADDYECQCDDCHKIKTEEQRG